jgi:hypothetical protein
MRFWIGNEAAVVERRELVFIRGNENKCMEAVTSLGERVIKRMCIAPTWPQWLTEYNSQQILVLTLASVSHSRLRSSSVSLHSRSMPMPFISIRDTVEKWKGIGIC